MKATSDDQKEYIRDHVRRRGEAVAQYFAELGEVLGAPTEKPTHAEVVGVAGALHEYALRTLPDLDLAEITTEAKGFCGVPEGEDLFCDVHPLHRQWCNQGDHLSMARAPITVLGYALVCTAIRDFTDLKSEFANHEEIWMDSDVLLSSATSLLKEIGYGQFEAFLDCDMQEIRLRRVKCTTR